MARRETAAWLHILQTQRRPRRTGGAFTWQISLQPLLITFISSVVLLIPLLFSHRDTWLVVALPSPPVDLRWGDSKTQPETKSAQSFCAECRFAVSSVILFVLVWAQVTSNSGLHKNYWPHLKTRKLETRPKTADKEMDLRILSHFLWHREIRRWILEK